MRKTLLNISVQNATVGNLLMWMVSDQLLKRRI